MAAPRILTVTGRKSAGKTTLVAALLGEYRRRGLRVGTLKHGHHLTTDREGSDTWRHFVEGKAERTLVTGPDHRVLWERAADDYDPMALARRYMADLDLVLCEGWKRSTLPKVEVWRKGIADAGPLCVEAPDDRWIAVVTDDYTLDVPVRTLRFSDTMWLQALASLTLERAAPLE